MEGRRARARRGLEREASTVNPCSHTLHTLTLTGILLAHTGMHTRRHTHNHTGMHAVRTQTGTHMHMAHTEEHCTHTLAYIQALTLAGTCMIHTGTCMCTHSACSHTHPHV